MEMGGAVQQVLQETARGVTPPLKVLHLFFRFAIYPSPLSASFCVPSVLKVRRCSPFGVFSSSRLSVCPLVFSVASANRRSFLVLTHG